MPAPTLSVAYATRSIRFLAAALMLLLGAVRPAAAIVDGTVDPNVVNSPWAGVGSFSIGTGTYTGVLIAPHYVLTAAHVVAHKAPADIVFNLNIGGDLTQRLHAAEVYVAPDFEGAQGFKWGGQHDLAIVRLAEPVSALAPVYDLYDHEMMRGTIITFVGYGRGGMGAIGPTEPARPEVKRVGSNVVDCFAFTMDADNCDMPDLVGNGPKALYLFDFDAPQSAPGRPNDRLPVGEATLAGGDSGSPSFVYVQGQWKVAGINTFVTRLGPNGATSVYGTVGGGVLVSGANGQWIRSIIDAASPDDSVRAAPSPPVPEPRSRFLLATGLALLAVVAWQQWRRRKRESSRP